MAARSLQSRLLPQIDSFDYNFSSQKHHNNSNDRRMAAITKLSVMNNRAAHSLCHFHRIV
jgi:hypothetical protein